jgi:hypothetical protein
MEEGEKEEASIFAAVVEVEVVKQAEEVNMLLAMGTRRR